MTKVLNLRFLGPIEIAIDDTAVTDLSAAKAQALLCYLALNGRSHSRQFLAGLLWGDLPEADARRNLRGVVMQLRQAVGDYLEISHQTLAFRLNAPHQLDVTQFAQLARQTDAAALAQAAALYRGDFLEDFHVRDAPEFEAWQAQQRLQLRQTAVAAFDTLLRHHESAQTAAAGIPLAQRLVQLDPTREKSHRQLMRLLSLAGERSQALEQYALCRRLLADELGVEPAAETAALAEQIRQNQPLTVGAAAPPRPSPRPAQPLPDEPPAFIAGPPITHPARFFGRESIVKRLFGLVRQRPLQNAAIIGPRRSGKTSLLHYLRSVTNTPPVRLRAEQRADWLPANSGHRWVFVDFQDPRLGTQSGLLAHLLAEMQLPAPESVTLDQFLETVSEQLDSPTIVLFDEIGVALSRYPELDDAFWESLRSLATNQVRGNLGFVLTSHEPPGALAANSGYGSPFFNIFAYTAFLGPLEESAARALIATAPVPFPDDDVAWILQQSERWPFLLQILCRERLVSLQEGDRGSGWRQDAERQLTPFVLPKDGA